MKLSGNRAVLSPMRLVGHAALRATLALFLSLSAIATPAWAESSAPRGAGATEWRVSPATTLYAANKATQIEVITVARNALQADVDRIQADANLGLARRGPSGARR